MSHIAVLGLGAMGSRMTINFANAGHRVTAWNRTTDVARAMAASHEVAVAETPRAAAAGADFVVSMVTDDAAALAVWLDADSGALAAMGSGAVAIESSTITPDTARVLGDAASGAGVGFVEAPVVGSRPQAEAGALFYILGGRPDHVATAQSVIDVNAGNSIRVGAVGNAATMKLAVNGLFAAQVAAYAEIAGFVERSDLDTGAAMRTLAALPITSPGLQRILGLISERSYAPNFPVELVAKDLAYLTSATQSSGAATPIMNAAHAVFAQGAAEGQAELDIAGIAQRYQAD